MELRLKPVYPGNLIHDLKVVATQDSCLRHAELSRQELQSTCAGGGTCWAKRNPAQRETNTHCNRKYFGAAVNS